MMLSQFIGQTEAAILRFSISLLTEIELKLRKTNYFTTSSNEVRQTSNRIICQTVAFAPSANRCISIGIIHLRI